MKCLVDEFRDENICLMSLQLFTFTESPHSKIQRRKIILDNMKIRLRHVPSGKYISVDSSGPIMHKSGCYISLIESCHGIMYNKKVRIMIKFTGGSLYETWTGAVSTDLYQLSNDSYSWILRPKVDGKLWPQDGDEVCISNGKWNDTYLSVAGDSLVCSNEIQYWSLEICQEKWYDRL